MTTLSATTGITLLLIVVATMIVHGTIRWLTPPARRDDDFTGDQM